MKISADPILGGLRATKEDTPNLLGKSPFIKRAVVRP
jgi:hypothetical protein